MNSYFHVIYLTGAPATGKSSLCKGLIGKIPSLSIIEYGSELTKYVNSKMSDNLTQDQLRTHSSLIVTKEDVDHVDNLIIKRIAKERLISHIIIDSHAVTKESYGYRVTSFNPEKLNQLNPSIIVNLYTEPRVSLERIKNDAAGRPTVTKFEANMHTHLQGSLSLVYGFQCGIPTYYLDSGIGREKLINWFKKKLT